MREAIFGPRYQEALKKLAGVSDPVQQIALTAHVARAIYEAESADLSVLMKASAFSPELRKTLQRFESLRREMQRGRIEALFAAGRARKGLNASNASAILWMLTGRDVYHKLVHESRWSPDAFQRWLEETLLTVLTDGRAVP